MSEWCHVCAHYGPCVHTENQARWEADQNRKALEREAVRRAKADTRNLTPGEAMEAKWRAEKTSPPPDSKEYWNQVHLDANRARRAAGWPGEPHGPGRKFGRAPDKPPPDPELSSGAGWRRPIEPPVPPPPKPALRKPVRKPAAQLWEVKSRFKVGGGHILIPNPKQREAIAEAAANYYPEYYPDDWPKGALMIFESQQQSILAAHAENMLNRILEAHWPTLEFSDLKPIPQNVHLVGRTGKLDPL